MLLAIIPQGTGSTALDTANSLADAIYRLGLTGSSELGVVPWLTADELYQFADDAVKQVSRNHGLFIVYDTSITMVAGTAAYSLPPSHVFTVMAVLIPASGPVTFLRLNSVRELWALDANWITTTGAAQRVSLDAGAVGTITVYPVPISGGALALICKEFPVTVTASATQISLPTVLQDYFTYAMLAGALGKESEAAMPEMAVHYRQRMDMYEQIMGHLWGPGL